MGKALNDALAAIGRANPKQLAGVFERTDFNNKMALPADDLRRIVDHFHALGPLTKERVSGGHARPGVRVADREVRRSRRQGRRRVLHAGRGRQALRRAARAARGRPRSTTPPAAQAVCCSSASNRAEAQGVNIRSLFLYGQELNPETWAIARMNMLLHGAGDAAEIKLGDTLAAPAFLDEGRAKEVRSRCRQSAFLVEELGARAVQEERRPVRPHQAPAAEEPRRDGVRAAHGRFARRGRDARRRASERMFLPGRR